MDLRQAAFDFDAAIQLDPKVHPEVQDGGGCRDLGFCRVDLKQQRCMRKREG